jgi:hypothetical protein
MPYLNFGFDSSSDIIKKKKKKGLLDFVGILRDFAGIRPKIAMIIVEDKKGRVGDSVTPQELINL